MWIETLCFGVAATLATVLLFHPYTSPFTPMPKQSQEPSSHGVSPSEDQFRFLIKDPIPITWPCNPTLDVVVDMGALQPAARPDVLADLEFAFNVIATHTAYSLVITHHIERTATSDNLDDLLDSYGADLLITFVVPGQTDLLSPHSIGTGGLRYMGHTARYGWVAFSATEYVALRPGPGPYTRHALIVHELLHALNLGHVNDTASVLFPRLSQGAGELGPGDIAGLNGLNEVACSR